MQSLKRQNHRSNLTQGHIGSESPTSPCTQRKCENPIRTDFSVVFFWGDMPGSNLDTEHYSQSRNATLNRLLDAAPSTRGRSSCIRVLKDVLIICMAQRALDRTTDPERCFRLCMAAHAIAAGSSQSLLGSVLDACHSSTECGHIHILIPIGCVSAFYVRRSPCAANNIYSDRRSRSQIHF